MVSPESLPHWAGSLRKRWQGHCRKRLQQADSGLWRAANIVDFCPLTKLAGGLTKLLHSADDDAVASLTNYSGPERMHMTTTAESVVGKRILKVSQKSLAREQSDTCFDSWRAASGAVFLYHSVSGIMVSSWWRHVFVVGSVPRLLCRLGFMLHCHTDINIQCPPCTFAVVIAWHLHKCTIQLNFRIDGVKKDTNSFGQSQELHRS